MTAHQRQDEALRLKVEESLSDVAIADRLGYTTRQAAYRAWHTALDRQPADNARQLRLTEAAKLDAMEAEVCEAMRQTCLVVSDGRVVYLEDSDGVKVPLTDWSAKYKGIMARLRIMERRAKMMGYDAPVRVQVLDAETVEGAIAELEAKMAANARGAPLPAE
jgi:hypothetical protein